jgi:hypothetical protein
MTVDGSAWKGLPVNNLGASPYEQGLQKALEIIERSNQLDTAREKIERELERAEGTR